MGVLVNGEWKDHKQPSDPEDTLLDRRITRDGSSGLPVETGRYRLYVSYGCPFSHRVLLTRSLMGLENVVAATQVSEIKRDNGWEIPEGSDPLFGATRLHQVMALAEPGVTGRAAVPILVDERDRRVVSTSSAAISEMFISQFGADGSPDLRPHTQIARIDALNEWIHDRINTGVYMAGLAPHQEAHEAAIAALFEALDTLEDRLSGQRYLHGAEMTQSDLWLFATLIRLESVYALLFKCVLRPLREYPNLWGFVRDLWSVPEVAGTVDFDLMKEHYFKSLIHTPHGAFELNPSGLIPVGPDLRLNEPHGREVSG
ncbi:MAG: glutathione S-transferase C-terminal domain-containing protein [Pseudomonadota bacterium]